MLNNGPTYLDHTAVLFYLIMPIWQNMVLSYYFFFFYYLLQFAGTWYTVSRTTHVFGENTYESGTIEFSENPDGSYTYALTGQL